ncbi:MAG: hypothetical protein HC896_07945 [Bacteroidales bacterium]|nr:hypothetical protein [Bacteroidales bacterium]
MHAPAPYNLIGYPTSCTDYFKTIDSLLNDFDKKPFMAPAIKICNDLETYLNQGKKTEINHERITEILSLAVYWRTCKGMALNSPALLFPLFYTLNKAREKWPGLKKHIDKARGYLTSRLLFNHGKHSKQLNPHVFYHLINWLKATNEFSQQTQYFYQWCTFVKKRTRWLSTLFF